MLCCDLCDSVYYCSELCQERSNRVCHHQDICQFERKLATWKADKDARSLMRLYVKVIQAFVFEGRPGQGNEDAQPEGGLNKSFTLQEALAHYGVPLDEEWAERVAPLQEHRFTPSSFAEALPLQSHISDWTKEDLQDWHKHRTFLQTFQATYLSAAGPLREGHREEVEARLREEGILSLISAFESNNFGIWSAKGEVLGRSIYPRSSYFNHACGPNCYTERKGPILFIVAEADIAKGEEVTISYIDTNQPRSARQTFLKQHYHFACLCQRCLQEQGAGGKIKVTYAKSKNHTQKGKIPKKKALWKERDPGASPPTLSDLIASVPIYAPLPMELLGKLPTQERDD